MSKATTGFVACEIITTAAMSTLRVHFVRSTDGVTVKTVEVTKEMMQQHTP
jgi:hypothetical protein